MISFIRHTKYKYRFKKIVQIIENIFILFYKQFITINKLKYESYIMIVYILKKKQQNLELCSLHLQSFIMHIMWVIALFFRIKKIGLNIFWYVFIPSHFDKIFATPYLYIDSHFFRFAPRGYFLKSYIATFFLGWNQPKIDVSFYYSKQKMLIVLITLKNVYDHKHSVIFYV